MREKCRSRYSISTAPSSSWSLSPAGPTTNCVESPIRAWPPALLAVRATGGRPPRSALPPLILPLRPARGARARSPIVFFGASSRQPFLRRPFQVNAHPVRQLRPPLYVRGLGVGQQLEVDVAPEAVFVPYQLGRGDHLVHRAMRAHDAGREEHAVDQPRPVHQVEGACHLVRGHMRAADIAARPKRTVVAVVLARTRSGAL